MGARGPLPQSNNIRQLRGNPGNHKTAPTVKAKPISPDPPKSLNLVARAEWDRMVPLLEDLGVIAQIDRSVLARYCALWAFHEELVEILNRGLVVDGRHEDRKSPAWQMFRETEGLLAALEKELLATPMVRARTVKPGDADGEQESYFD